MLKRINGVWYLYTNGKKIKTVSSVYEDCYQMGLTDGQKTQEVKA